MWRRLNVRLLGFLLLIWILMGIIYTLLSFFQQRQLLYDDAERFLTAVVRLKSTELSNWHLDKQQKIRELTLNSTNQAYFYAQLDDEIPLTDRSLQQGILTENLNTLRKTDPALTEISFVDVDGTVRVSTDRAAVEHPTPYSNLISGVFAGEGGHYVQDIQWDSIAGNRFMIFAEAVYIPGTMNFRSPENIVGVLYAVVRLEEEFFPLLEGNQDLGRTGEFVLVRLNNGRVQILNELRFNLNSAFSLLNIPIEEERRHPGLLAALGGTGFVSRNDYRQEPVLVAYRHVPGTEWGLLAKQDQFEIYPNLTTVASRMLWPMVIGAFFLVIVGLLITIDVINPLRQITEAARQWARYGWEQPRTLPPGSIFEIEKLNEALMVLKTESSAGHSVLQKLTKVLLELNRNVELLPVLPVLLGNLRDMSSADQVGLLLWDPDQNRFGASYFLKEEELVTIPEGEFQWKTAVQSTLRSRQPHYESNLTAATHNSWEQKLVGEGCRSALALPMFAYDTAVGVLHFCWHRLDGGDRVDVALLNDAGTGLAHGLLRVQKRNRRLDQIVGLQTVLNLTHTLRAADTLEELAKLLLGEALKSTRGDYGRLYLNDISAAAGSCIGAVAAELVPAAAEKEIRELQRSVALSQQPVEMAKDPVGAIIVCPLLEGNQLIGNMVIGRASLHRFDEIERDLLLSVADIGGIALSRVSSRELLERNVAIQDQELAVANKRLADANERLRQLDLLKSQFVSDVSHELRTPITNLRLYLNLLSRNPDEQKTAHYQAVLRYQAERLEQLVDDILDLSRLELGGRLVQFAPIDLNTIVDKVVGIYRVQAANNGVKLSFRPDIMAPLIKGERNQLAQVVTNLVGNALNYTPSGSIEVTTRYDEERRHLCLCVKDTGIGISPDDIPFIFDRFYRGDHSELNVAGTGLGLGIVKEIVDIHHGQIEVESERGEGTQIRIWLQA